MKSLFVLLFIGLFHSLSHFVCGFKSKSGNNIPKTSALKAAKSNERRPWKFGRFFKTLAYYDALPVIPSIKKLFQPFKSAKGPITKGFILWSPTKQDLCEFGPLDDVVMGGASKSDLSPGQVFNGKWTGVTTSANNGGFAGIRCKMFDPALDVSSCEGIEFKVTGDGQRYKFIARDDTNWNGIAWSYSFDTKSNKLISIKIPFKKLRPTKFARTVPGNTLFNQASFRGLQFSLSKFEYDGGFNPNFKEGPFSLNIEEIKTY